MNRREFSQLAVGAAMGHTVLRGNAGSALSSNDTRFSAMLWPLEKQAPMERCIEMVAAAGYQGVELVGEFQKWSSEDHQRITSKMGSLGLAVDAMSGVKAGFAVPEDSADFKSQFAVQVSAAKALECPLIILLSGRRVEGLDPNVQYQTAIENLKYAADVVSKNNLKIVIEPIDPLENPTIYMSTVIQGFKIVREIGNQNVKVLYDFYHEQRAYGNLIEKLEDNIDWIGLVHIADVPGRHEPGTGEIDYANIYRKLAELKYTRWIAMEYYATEDTTESLRKSRLAALEAMHPKRLS